MEEIEYRVRPVTRYIVTRYHNGIYGSGVETVGEFPNSRQANVVATALANEDGGTFSACLEDESRSRSSEVEAA